MIEILNGIHVLSWNPSTSILQNLILWTLIRLLNKKEENDFLFLLCSRSSNYSDMCRRRREELGFVEINWNRKWVYLQIHQTNRYNYAYSIYEEANTKVKNSIRSCSSSLLVYLSPNNLRLSVSVKDSSLSLGN